MLRRAALGMSSLALAAVLLLNFQGADETTAALLDSPGGSAAADTRSASLGTGVGSGSGGASPATAAPAATADGTFTGDLVSTRYGPVQVQITVQGGAIVDVRAVALPTGGHSGQISSIVEGLLRSEALAAQSASIDGISGATYTSRAYATSLQSAIDQAGI